MKPIDLFYQYQSYCESIAEQSASFSTFRRVQRAIFKDHLKFRDKGSFSQCSVCFKLRQRIAKSNSKKDKDAATALYTRHLLSQWLDRQAYWHARSLSRQYFLQGLHRKLHASSDLSTSVLCVIQDGMDQAKLRLPRWGYGRTSKQVERIYRPCLHLVASWVHGFKLDVHLSDEDVKKDSTTSIEVLCRTLSGLYTTATRLPLVLWIQHDNTPREAKNRYFLNFLLMLQVIGAFRATGIYFLRTAHSHEDVDQAFGQISRLLAGKTLMCDRDVMGLLNECFMSGQDPGEKSGRLRGSVAEAFKVDQTACWKEFVAQTGLSFKGLRHAHSFRFTLRRDLGADVLNNVQNVEEYSGQHRPSADDVVLVTKRWLHDAEVQRAAVVLPADLAVQIRQGFQMPGGVAARRRIGDQVIRNITSNVPKLRKSGEMSKDGAEYLLSWCAGTLPRLPRPESYSILDAKYSEAMKAEPRRAGAWPRPRRVKHFDLSFGAEADGPQSDGSSDSDGPVQLPDGFGG